MIRQLTQADHAACMDLVNQKPAENLFIIGDIEMYGYENDFQKLWGDFTEDGKLIAVLLKYKRNYIAYADTLSFNGEGFASIMEKDPDFKMLSGLEEIADQIIPHLSLKQKERRALYYAKCTSEEKLDKTADLTHVLKAVPDDANALVNLTAAIPEFENAEMDADSKRENLESGFARSYYIKQDGKLVSAASTTAENSSSAMIVGVCTLEDYKKNGYATQCMTKLCAEVLAEGKVLCLFYDNPEAGKIYKRIGFEDIGMWMMNSFEPLESTVKS
ncbi:GNAT family N-acetyltransferase [Thalassobacillus hwangdonensis]|uniref:GNAT family N-acetyltransferase n=1 Tax=Thalassobacillus hwangdonensis TaxID=546108 RepID=A0ABW3L6F1_9BACI